MRNLFIVLLLVSLGADAQWTITGSKTRFAKGLGIPVNDTTLHGSVDTALIVMRSADSSLYYRYKSRYNKLNSAAQYWTLNGNNLYPTTIGNNVGVGKEPFYTHKFEVTNGIGQLYFNGKQFVTTNDTTKDNIFIAPSAGENNTSNYTIAIGNSALKDANGSNQIGIGYGALTSTVGNRNVSVGDYSGVVNDGSDNSFYGFKAPLYGFGSGLTGIGSSIGFGSTIYTQMAVSNTGTIVIASTTLVGTDIATFITGAGVSVGSFYDFSCVFDGTPPSCGGVVQDATIYFKGEVISSNTIRLTAFPNFSAQGTGTYSINLYSSINNSIAIGYGAKATNSNQFALPSNIDTIYAPGLATGARYVLTDALGDGKLALSPGWAQYDVCGNLIQPNLSNILKTGSFLDNDYTVDMNDHDFTIGGRGVFIIDGDKFYVNNIEGTADTDSIWALNKNNKVVKIPNGGQYWQAINGGTTLNNKGSSILNIKFNLPFTVDSISTQYLLKLGAPGFVPVSFGSINNNIAVYSDAGYPSFKLNKAGLDTFYRKLTGTFTGDHFANLQDKNGTLAYWGDNLSLFTNDINFDGVYFKQSNLFSEISGSPNKAIARTNLGASVAGSNIFKITDPSAVSWIRINADNSVSSRTATQTLDDLGGTTIGQNIFTLTNPSAVRYLKINADNTVSARTASNMLGDLNAAPLASPSFTGTLVSAGTVTVTNGNLVLGTAGNGLTVTEGTGGKVGQSTLVSGTKAITITGLTTSSRAFVQLVTASGVTLTVNYQAVCTANTLTVQANIAAGTINTADASTFNYWIIN